MTGKNCGFSNETGIESRLNQFSDFFRLTMYSKTHPIRIVTATSLFDGHDASINMIRRLLQSAGAEVIHLGHNRSVLEVVTAVLQEGAQGVCLSSYQGGHIEYFKYMKDLFKKSGADYVKIFGGGGGVIIHEEKKELQDYGIDFIFHPDDGRRMGLGGMIDLIMEKCDFPIYSATKNFEKDLCPVFHVPSQGKDKKKPSPDEKVQESKIQHSDNSSQDGISNETAQESEIQHRLLGLALSYIENGKEVPAQLKDKLFSPSIDTASPPAVGKNSNTESGRSYDSSNKNPEKNSHRNSDKKKSPRVLGVTGTGGAGKSSLVDELIQRFLNNYPKIKLAVLCIDPSKKKTGGALLGDRIRMNSLSRSGVFMHSSALRQSHHEISGSTPKALDFLKNCGFDLILVETSGIGQANTAIVEISDFNLYVMTPEFGAQSQLEKIDMIDYAHFIAINKADRRGSSDALRDVKKQYKRSRKIFNTEDESLPVFLTQAGQFNDLGVNKLFFAITEDLISQDSHRPWLLGSKQKERMGGVKGQKLIPTERQNHLNQIAKTILDYKEETLDLCKKASRLGAFYKLREELKALEENQTQNQSKLSALEEKLKKALPPEILDQLENWDKLIQLYKVPEYIYKVRGKEIRQNLYHNSPQWLENSKTHSTGYYRLGGSPEVFKT